MKKCFDTNVDVNLVLLQVRSTPVCPCLPIPATIIFNRPIRDLLYWINLSPMWNYSEENYNAFKLRHGKLTNNNDTLKEPISLHTRSTLPVQGNDGGLQTHDTFIGHGNEDHNGRWYKICIMKTGQIVTRTTGHINHAMITAEQYFSDHLSKEEGYRWTDDDMHRYYDQDIRERIQPTHIFERTKETLPYNKTLITMLTVETLNYTFMALIQN